MLALHFSHTPLVGAPGRVCAALRQVPGVDARWVVLDTQAGQYEKMSFALDLVWPRDRDEVLALLARCDVVHLHNYLHLDSPEFAPISFRALWDAGQPMLRQIHSTPELIARFNQQPLEAVHACPIPKAVLAQFHERYFPTARLVPNVVTLDPPRAAATGPLRIGYAPTRFNSGRSLRWDTKGYGEIRKLLERLRRAAAREGLPLEVDIIEQVPHAECLVRKARCDLFIDDLVTGSYHLNTLEALAQGSVCLTYLDGGTVAALQALTGRSDFPALNVGLEDALPVLLALCRDPALTRALGEQNRRWMQAHWDPVRMVSHFVSLYQAVIAAPGQPFAARRADDAVARWQAIGQYDALWAARQAHWPRLTPAWMLAPKAALGRTLRALGLR